MIPRELTPIILKNLNSGKVILILGPRQVGKTTLVKHVVDLSSQKTLWLNGDEADIRLALTDTTSTRLKTMTGGYECVVLDEAQQIPNIGLTLKLMVDSIPDVNIIATGSSSLELASKINEPLTGRKFEYFLYPISYKEMIDATSSMEEQRLLEHRMIYGYYPEVVTSPGQEKNILASLSDSYLYKDLFVWEQIKKPVLLEKILQALALQISNEVSYHEIGQLVGADNQTIERYIDLLEKAFVIFRLSALSRNLRNELKRAKKIYFYDNGIRNAILKNFSPLAFRQDVGALWENFIISERKKANHYSQRWLNSYFWRTHSQREIDYIEEYEGVLHATEIKWNPKKKPKIPQPFSEAYPSSEFEVITPENYVDFIVSRNA